MRFTTQLLPSRSGNLGQVLLNHPKALHALSMEMIYSLQDVLESWRADDSLRAILIKSNKNSESKRKAFCAGGDVKGIALSIMESSSQQNTSDEEHGRGVPGLLSADFFRHEYKVNHNLATHFTSKPQIR